MDRTRLINAANHVFIGVGMIFVIIFACLVFYKLFKVFGNAKYAGQSVNCANLDKEMKIVEINEQKNYTQLAEVFPEYKNIDCATEFEKLFDDIFYAFVESRYIFLKEHLSENLYEKFAEQIEKRQAANLRQEIEIKHKITNILKIINKEDKVIILIQFTVSQMSAMYNYNNNVSYDNPNKVFLDIKHEWQMERKDSSRQWIITKTNAKEC